MSSVSAFTVWFSSLHHSVKNKQHFPVWAWSSFHSWGCTHQEPWQHSPTPGGKCQREGDTGSAAPETSVTLPPCWQQHFQTQGSSKPWAEQLQQALGGGEQSSLVELSCVGAGLATGAGASGGQRGSVSSGTSSERESEGSLPVNQHKACLDNRQLSAWLSALELLDFSNSSPWTSERALTAIPQGTVAFSLMQKPGHEFETTSALWIFFPMM